MATIVKTADVAPCSLVDHHHLWHDSPLWAITFLLWISWLQALYWVGCHPRAQPPPWMTRPPYLWPPETGCPSYTPGHWVPILVVFYDTHELRWDYSYPPVTHGKVWQIMCINMFDSDTIHFNASLTLHVWNYYNRYKQHRHIQAPSKYNSKCPGAEWRQLVNTSLRVPWIRPCELNYIVRLRQKRSYLHHQDPLYLQMSTSLYGAKNNSNSENCYAIFALLFQCFHRLFLVLPKAVNAISTYKMGYFAI
jgi:hypothetical protein